MLPRFNIPAIKVLQRCQNAFKCYLTNIPAIKVNTEVSERILMLPRQHSRYKGKYRGVRTHSNVTSQTFPL